MTPTHHRRRPSPVEAMHLAHLRDLPRAEAWLRRRGIGTATTHPALHGRGLHIPTRRGGHDIARLGEWVYVDLATGRVDWATGEEFGLLCEAAVTGSDGLAG